MTAPAAPPIRRHPDMRIRGRQVGHISGIVVHDTVTRDHTPVSVTAGVLVDGVTQARGNRIPPPIYHFLVGVDGEIWQLADTSLRANHAGKVDGHALAQMRDRYQPESGVYERRGTHGRKSGNTGTLGVAFARSGRKQVDARQWEAMVALLRYLCHRHDLAANQVVGHHELTRRKVDPSRMSMADLRAALTRDTPAPVVEGAEMVRPTLRMGVRSHHLIAAQTRLRACGLLSAEQVSGRFDRHTYRAVTIYQACHWLATDGVIGPDTWRALLERGER